MESILVKSKGKVETIKLDWDNIEPDEILAGTPIGEDGQIHNDGKAKGVLVRTVSRLWDGTADILVAGDVDTLEAETIAGVAINSKAKKALHDITFSGDSRKVDRKNKSK